MLSPDAFDRLAYTDVSGLDDIIEREWTLFGDSLVPLDVWKGRFAEIRTIRNRIGHCRRPHEDDLTRLELMLRDLELGVRKAVKAFHDREVPSSDLRDEVVASWIRRDHETARRLLDHGERQYDIHFRLSFSKRPWAEARKDRQAITGHPGYVWHATWILRDDPADLVRFWNDDYLNGIRENLLLVCADFPAAVEVSFPALENGQAIADAIGVIFDVLVWTRWRGARDDAFFTKWATDAKMLDPRVQVESPWGDAGLIEGSVFGV